MADATSTRTTSGLRVALIGAGRQGLALLQALTNPAAPVPGVRVVAVCDIWDFARDRALALLRDAGQRAAGHPEWTELLDKEHGLDAVFIATPDRLHAPIAQAALAAGLHVYLEPMIAQTLDEARRVIRLARERGRLVQMGYDRRSHPRFRLGCEQLWRNPAAVGRPAAVHAQHHERDCGYRYSSAAGVDSDRLRRHGYASMHHLLNWPRLALHAGHLLPRRAPYQLDLMSWFLQATPQSVLAAGGRNLQADRDSLDNIFAILAYDLPQGRLRACYQASSLTSSGGAGEWTRFDGTRGSVSFPGNGAAVEYRPERSNEANLEYEMTFEYCRLVRGNGIRAVVPRPDWDVFTINPSFDLIEAYGVVPTAGHRTVLQPHVENFLAAIRGDAALNAPAESTFATEVAVRRIVEAVAARREVALTGQDFATGADAAPDSSRARFGD